MTTVDPHDLMNDAHRHRKAEILRLAQDAVELRGQRRRARRHALAMVAITAAATVLVVTLAPSRTSGPGTSWPGMTGSGKTGPGVIAGGGSGPTPSSTPGFVRVATTAGLASTLTAGGTAGTASITIVHAGEPAIGTVTRVATTPAVPRIGDAEALGRLAEAGTPAGLIRVEGRTTLVYHERPEAAEFGPSGQACWRGGLLASW